MIAGLLLTSRPLSWVNTAYPFAAAYLLTVLGTGGGIDVRWVIGTVFFLIPYNLAMYGINDVFDFESDLRNPRKGGVEGAVLDRRAHRVTLVATVVTTAPFILALVLLGSPLSWLVLAVSLFAVVAYSAPGLRFKEIPGVDSLTSSVHFVSPALYGFVLAGARLDWQLAALLLAFLFWGVASHALGAVQDIRADREAGIGSVATALGGRITVRLAIVAYAAAGALMLATVWPGPLAGLLVLPYIGNALPFWAVSDDHVETVNRAWRRFLALNLVTGFLVTLLLVWWSSIR